MAEALQDLVYLAVMSTERQRKLSDEQPAVVEVVGA
jgi:hypothetical protein